MQALFEWEAHPRPIEDIFADRIEDLGQKISDTTFARDLLFGITKMFSEVRAVIQKYAPEWPVEKIDPVERVILYIGVFELVFMNDAPAAVIINEGIELAKTYADENSNKFINGVLNAVAKKEQKSV